MKNRALTIIAILLGAFIIGAVIYLVTQKTAQQQIGSYKTGVAYPTSPISMSLWLPSDEKDNIEPIIAEYNKIHPNVSVVVEYSDNSQYQAKLLNAISTNTAPDMFVYRGGSLPLYKKAISPVPASVIEAKDYTNTFAEFSTKQLVSSNTIYGMPLGIATLGQIYNTQRFSDASISQPSKDWNEFVSNNTKLRKLDGTNLVSSGVALGTAAIHNYPDIISILMIQNGATMTNQPPTQATFDQPISGGYYPGAKSLAFYASFAQSNKQNYSWNDTLGDSTNALATDKTALIIDYPMSVKQIRKANPSINVSTSALPQTNVDLPYNYGATLVGSVSKDSKLSEIAWDFWGFATTKPAQRIFSQNSYWPASRKDLIEEQKNDKDLGVFANQTATATDWYKGFNFTTNAELSNMLSYYLTGLDPQITVKNAATNVTKSIQLSNQ